MCSDDFEGFENRTLEVDGYRLNVRLSSGPAPPGSVPVVLVHGLGVSSRHWMPAGRLLACNHAVVAPDLPGSGRSDKPRRALTLIELADVLAACMDELGVGPAAVLGVSYGCQIVIDVAVHHPDKVRAAVLVAPTMDPTMGPIEHFVRLLMDAPREPLSLMPVVARDYLDFGIPRAIATLNDAMEDWVLEEAEQVDVPALVVRGSRDPIVSEQWAKRLTSALPDGSLHEIPGAAHATNFNSADEVVDLVEGFLAAELGA
jgi:2-hydroxy-6-oxonona-2,4-dienedioate hydrolase